MFSVFSCSTAEDDDPIIDPKDTTANTATNGTNLNPNFSFMFKGKKVEFSKIQADYGSKTYFTGFDKTGAFTLDMAIPMPKGVTASGKSFSIEDDQYTGMGFYMEAEDIKWYLEGGSINITKNSGNVMSGSFSAKALLLDYSSPGKIIRLDSTDITNGVFTNLKVKG